MRIFIILFLSINLIQGLSAQTQDLESKIDFLFSEFTNPKQSGANILVIQKEKILFQKSYGVANLSNGTPSQAKTQYRLASVTKQFTAMCILLLEDKGKLSFEQNLCDIFPDFPSYGKKIKLLHLLQHTSGLKDYEKLPKPKGSAQLTDQDVYNMLKKCTATHFEPGTRYKYSNSGYAILAEIVRKVSGESFRDFVHNHIFEPLNMEGAIAFRKGDLLQYRAYGTSRTSSGGFVTTDQSRLSGIWGDGGIYMSVEDYVKWDAALANYTLLPKGKQDAAFRTWDGAKNFLPKREYGMGWYISYDGNTKVLWHRGGTIGFTNVVVRVPELELTVVILCNRNRWRNIWQLGFGVLHYIAPDKIKMPIDIQLFSLYKKYGIDKAKQYYDEYKKQPNSPCRYHPAGLNRLGLKFLSLNLKDYAKWAYSKNTIEYPESWVAWEGLGYYHEKQKEYAQAKDCYQQSVKFLPEYPTEDEKEIIKKIKHKLKKW
ncbi:MAG: serine hydrolase [Saprospiraceae bacterium]|nr:serine hydrolase [Saprospiraceae bacterium]